MTTRESLPGALPPDERVLWCGGPGGAQLARYALHVRKFAVYFALLLGWRLLADRALSRLLKSDWPRTLEELEERSVSPPGRLGTLRL